jgi:hypothetical protein
MNANRPCGVRVSKKNPDAYTKDELIEIALDLGYKKTEAKKMTIKELCDLLKSKKSKKSSKRVVKKSSRKVSRKPSRKSSRRVVKKSSRKVSRKVVKKSSRKSSKKSSKKSSRKVSRKSPIKSSRKVSRKPSRKSSRKVVKKSSKKSSRRVSRKSPIKSSRKVSRKSPIKSSRKVSRKSPIRFSKKVSRKSTVKSSKKSSQRQVNPEKKFFNILKKNGISLQGDLPFKFIKVLGEGMLGIVFLVEYKNKKYVLKVQKSTIDISPGPNYGQHINEYYSTLYLSGKKYFPKVEKVFYANDYRNKSIFFILSEFIEGSTLSNFIKSFSSKDDYKKLKNKIIEIITWFCKNNVVHGDFHLNNIIVIEKGNDYDLKVIDYGYTHVETPCNPHADLIKFITGLYFSKAPQELINVFVDYYKQTYLDKEKCIKGDVKFDIGFKHFSTKKVNEILQKEGLNFNFFNACYQYYFEDVSESLNVANFFNLDKSKKVYGYDKTSRNGILLADFSKYDKYFQKI